MMLRSDDKASRHFATLCVVGMVEVAWFLVSTGCSQHCRVQSATRLVEAGVDCCTFSPGECSTHPVLFMSLFYIGNAWASLHARPCPVHFIQLIMQAFSDRFMLGTSASE